MQKIKVLIVDDSALVRELLSHILAEDDEIEIVGTAIDPVFAMQKIMRDPPDVITLDVEMPRMDGLTFLQKLMKSFPIPVVMISSRTRKGCETTLKALELGAVDFIAKPEHGIQENLAALKEEVIAKVKNAGKVNLKPAGGLSSSKELEEINSSQIKDSHKVKFSPGHTVVAIGASTGGVVAVSSVIAKLRPADYSVLITLHMPPRFTASFAERLGAAGGWNSAEAEDGQPVAPRNIYVAPGGKNMTVEKQGGSLIIRVRPCEKGDVYKPNVDKTFASVAGNIGRKAIGVIMTGMGDDGAKGLLMMKQSGAVTIAQSPETCMVYGMPRKAVEAGAVDYVVPLEHIAAKVMQLI